MSQLTLVRIIRIIPNNSHKRNFLLLLTKLYKIIELKEIERMYRYILYSILVLADPMRIDDCFKLK